MRLASKKLQSLLDLELRETLIDDVAIAQLSSFPNLRKVDMSGCGLKGSALSVLQEKEMKSLQIVVLNYNFFTEDDVLSFAVDVERSKFKSLGAVSFKGVSLSKEKYLAVMKISQSKKIQFVLD